MKKEKIDKKFYIEFLDQRKDTLINNLFSKYIEEYNIIFQEQYKNEKEYKRELKDIFNAINSLKYKYIKKLNEIYKEYNIPIDSAIGISHTILNRLLISSYSWNKYDMENGEENFINQHICKNVFENEQTYNFKKFFLNDYSSNYIRVSTRFKDMASIIIENLKGDDKDNYIDLQDFIKIISKTLKDKYSNDIFEMKIEPKIIYLELNVINELRNKYYKEACRIFNTINSIKNKVLSMKSIIDIDKYLINELGFNDLHVFKANKFKINILPDTIDIDKNVVGKQELSNFISYKRELI